MDRVVDPGHGETLAEVPRTDAAGAGAAIAAARAAFEDWRRRPPAERAAALHELANLLTVEAAPLAELESRNVGKPIAATPDEIDFSVDNLRFFAGAGALSSPGRPRASTSTARRRWCAASPSVSSRRSRRGTTR
jgi:acyl-CoA reductase-like NAD-dependent aldehyde dehydrogenase